MSILDKMKAKAAAEKNKQDEVSPTPRKIGIAKPKASLSVPEEKPPANLIEAPQSSGTAKKLGLKIKPSLSLKKPPVTIVPKTAKPEAKEKPDLTGAALGGAIGKLLAGSDDRQEIAINSISPDALAALNSTDSYFDIEELYTDWPDVSDDTEEDAEDRQEKRDAVVKSATAELNNIYLSEMDVLQTCDAAHPVITNISQIIKLLLQRAKQSPSSIDILDLKHVSAIVRGLKLMAAKRQSATTKAKSGARDLSDALEKATVVDGYSDDEIAAMGSDLDDIDLGF